MNGGKRNWRRHPKGVSSKSRDKYQRGDYKQARARKKRQALDKHNKRQKRMNPQHGKRS